MKGMAGNWVFDMLGKFSVMVDAEFRQALGTVRIKDCVSSRVMLKSNGNSLLISFKLERFRALKLH